MSKNIVTVIRPGAESHLAHGVEVESNGFYPDAIKNAILGGLIEVQDGDLVIVHSPGYRETWWTQISLEPAHLIPAKISFPQGETLDDVVITR